VKEKMLALCGQQLNDRLNYGLYLPPANGKAGKFLDEERPLQDYPLPLASPFGLLEVCHALVVIN
jgi:SH3/ankyrin repeat-containing protein